MAWKISKERPEEKFESSRAFYSSPDSRTHSSENIERIQRKLTLRAVELLMPPLESRVLDAGSGNGFSLRVLRELGFKQVTGVDSSPEMVRKALLSGLHTMLGDFTKLPFKDDSFDAIVSISALQWVSHKPAELKKTVSEFRRVLAKRGCGAIHFYPKSSDELKVVEKEFRLAGFRVSTQIDNPKNARKRRVFVIFERG